MKRSLWAFQWKWSKFWWDNNLREIKSAIFFDTLPNIYWIMSANREDIMALKYYKTELFLLVIHFHLVSNFIQIWLNPFISALEWVVIEMTCNLDCGMGQNFYLSRIVLSAWNQHSHQLQFCSLLNHIQALKYNFQYDFPNLFLIYFMEHVIWVMIISK